MNDPKFGFEKLFGMEYMLSANTIIAVLGIVVATWLWIVTP